MELKPPEVSDRNNSDEAKLPPQLLYRGLFANSLHEVHIWKVDRDDDGAIVTWRLVAANPAALEMWGRDAPEVVGRTADEIFNGFAATETFLPVVREIFETGRPKEWRAEFPPTGEVLHMVSVPFGEYFVSTGVDISHMERQARALDEALRRMNQAVHAGGVGLWDWDLATDEIRFSEEWKRQLGYAPDEVADAFGEWESRVHPDDLDAALETISNSIATANQEHETVVRLRHKDGTYRWILARASFVLDEGGTPIRMMGSHIDITERRRLEKRVLESQKLESIGTLAAGIAHDFNNMLTVVAGNLSLLQEGAASGSEEAEVMGEIERATESAKGLTSQLLTFAKGGSPVRKAACIGDLIRECAALATRGTAATCQVRVDADLATVEVDVTQISQVVNNLVINAVQAMPAGGRMSVGASNAQLARGNPHGLSPGGYVRISVSDEGEGVSPEVMQRVFDLFFSTKPAGSGLGLATSHSIVSRHGGRIVVESPVGEGATFHVYLPASDKPVAPKTSPREVVGSGRILLVDDQPAVRSTVTRMLSRLGYTCDAVEDGDHAEERYVAALASEHPYDAVILDLTIPGKPGGRHVVRALAEVDPRVRAIVMSGYADDPVLAEYEAHGFRGRLGKPMSQEALSEEVARVVGAE